MATPPLTRNVNAASARKEPVYQPLRDPELDWLLYWAQTHRDWQYLSRPESMLIRLLFAGRQLPSESSPQNGHAAVRARESLEDWL